MRDLDILNEQGELRLMLDAYARSNAGFAQRLEAMIARAQFEKANHDSFFHLLNGKSRKINLKTGLMTWASQNEIRPVDFAQRMEYTPAYAWSLIRGTAPVTVACLGQFVLVYGGQAAEELLMATGATPVEPTVTDDKTDMQAQV